MGNHRTQETANRDKLRAIIKSSGLSIRELSLKSGVSANTLMRLIRPSAPLTDISAIVIHKLAFALEVDTGYLIEYVYNIQPLEEIPF